MSASDAPSPAKRRGRRPAGQDTRAALIKAAREVFSESGYEGATVRAIAARAGVDAAMVNHWFGGKEALFAQVVLKLPFDPDEVVNSVLLAGSTQDLGERVLRRFLTLWDATAGGTFPAMVRSITTHAQAATGLRDFLVKHVFGHIVDRLQTDHPHLRATLCASQLIGIGMIRYVAKFEPLASAEIETVVTAVAPTLQRYLTGDLGLDGH